MISPINGNNANNDSSPNLNNDVNNKPDPSIWVKFNDSNGKVDLEDAIYVEHNGKTKESNAIIAFLTKNRGNSWSKDLRSEFDKLIKRHNLECEGDAELEGAHHNSQSWLDDVFNDEDLESFGGEKSEAMPTMQRTKINKSPDVGNKVSILNDDGSSFVVDSKTNTITKYNSDGEKVGQRKMTAEEIELPTSELFNQLNDVEFISDEKVSSVKLNRNGIYGSYEFIDKGDGTYEINSNCTIVLEKSPIGKAFMTGLTNKFGMTDLEPDSQGFYNFRGISAKTKNALYAVAKKHAEQLALQTEVYKDLKDNGKILTDAEKAFCEAYEASLGNYGLMKDAEGNFVDKPSNEKSNKFKDIFKR